MRDGETLDRIRTDLSEPARQALDYLLERDGVVPWEDFAQTYGNDQEEPAYNPYADPETPTALLRLSGLLFVGTREGEQYAQVPAELRERLRR